MPPKPAPSWHTIAHLPRAGLTLTPTAFREINFD
jgi:hypothetical protein